MKRSLLCVATLVLGWICPALAGELVKLKVTDSAGVERAAEPLTNGVPFPEGAVTDAGKLGLVGPDGKPVPAVFTAACLWPKDKSVRWAHLDAQLSVAAKGAAEYAVVLGGATAPKTPVTVEDGADAVTVNTGVLKFTVRKKGFRLFDAVWLDESGAGKFDDAHRLLAECPEGLAMTVKGKRYTSAGDQSSKVEIEERNPMRVALLATGRLAGGPEGYSYQVRIHAYAGSSLVKVVPTIIKKFGRQRDENVVFEDLSLGLKLADAKDLSYALGGDDAPAAGKLAAGKTAGVLVSSSTKWEFTGEAKGSGDPKAKKPLTLGWADLSGPAGGVAVGVFRFWQVWPKGLEVSGDGAVTVGLMPKAAAPAGQEFYTGMARTHWVLVDFHGKAAPAEVQKRFVALQQPLFAQAPAEWYCQGTRALGPLAAAGTALPGTAAEEIKKEDEHLLGLLTNLNSKWQDSGTPRCPGLDAYGFLAYGDSLHHFWGSPKDKWKVQWDSHYYDMDHLVLLMWARTGDRLLLDAFTDKSWHLEDVAVLHWNENPKLVRGGSRRCPAMNHVGYDGSNSYVREPSWNQYDHHKSESMFERYYLLADRFALETAEDLVFQMQNPFNGKDGTPGNRWSAHQTISLIAGYWHTGDKQYLEHARKVVDTNIARQDQFDGGFNAKQQFADGIIAESMVKYCLASGDEDVAKAVVRWAEWQIKNGLKTHWGSNGSMAQAFAYLKTGDEKFLKAAGEVVHYGNSDNIGKDIAESWRNYPYTSGLLTGRGK